MAFLFSSKPGADETQNKCREKWKMSCLLMKCTIKFLTGN